MKLGKLQKMLVVFLTLWACVYPILLCSSLSIFGNWFVKWLSSDVNVCDTFFCPHNDPVPALGGLAGFVYHPLVISLSVVMYIALLIFYFRLRQTRQGRRLESEKPASQSKSVL
jgi:hypothetical protein